MYMPVCTVKSIVLQILLKFDKLLWYSCILQDSPHIQYSIMLYILLNACLKSVTSMKLMKTFWL